MEEPVRARTRSRKEQEVASDEESTSRVGTDDLFSPSGSEEDDDLIEESDYDEPKGRLRKGLGKKSVKKEPSHRKLTQLTEDLNETHKIQFRSLARHRNVLQKFVSEKTFRLLEAETTKAGGSSFPDTSTIVTQPPSITNCTMRSYQLEGLNWLVQQYDRRLNCILGDEMGLGSKYSFFIFFFTF